MKIEILGPSQFRAQTWKNGGGSTLELYRFPDNDCYSLRISVATVNTSGPFSKFPDYLRTIIQLEGPSMVLHHPDQGKEKILDLFSPYNFDGEWHTECSLSQVTRDFNVFYKKDTLKIETTVLHLPPNQVIALPNMTNSSFLFCVKGRFDLNYVLETKTIEESELCVIRMSEQSASIKLATNNVATTFVLVTMDQG